jgi:hypothetical protein
MPLAIRHVDTRRLRPPRAELRLDVHLGNDADEPAWALLPDTLGPEPRAPGRSVWSIAGWLLGELRRTYVLHATGDAGWYAIRVPARGDVTVAALPFAWWGELPEAVELEAALVTGLTVGGEPVAVGLGGEPPADTGAVVDAGRLADPAAVDAAISGSPAEPLAVTWTDLGGARARAELA